ncbi:hypothetical protein [Helicobacter rodentium]|uniref:hypothetical protein n=1 Tax=Helicobacter rodentium TaxID=59617 RepID=UPI0023532CF5|nr:hypothetical protein [Helicobacter rodentium]
MQEFFEKTIAACGSGDSGLDSALFKQLQKDGIMANFADLSADERGIYFRFSSNKICKIMLYQARIQEMTFRSKGDPFVHLCGCEEALENLKNPDFIATISLDLRFFLGIYSHKVQTKFFNDKPLKICPICAKTLAESFNNDLREFLRG